MISVYLYIIRNYFYKSWGFGVLGKIMYRASGALRALKGHKKIAGGKPPKRLPKALSISFAERP